MEDRIAELKAELQTNFTVKRQQEQCLDLSKNLFGSNDFTYQDSLESIKNTTERIKELETTISLLETAWNNKNEEKVWN